MPRRATYVPDIDVLRAVAVILVILFHFFPYVVPGGYVGVDIFFVISGFVISRSYLEPILSNQTTLRAFYVARLRRLSPALFVVLLVSTIAAYSLILPNSLTLYAKSLIAQPFYLQNFVFWNEGDYFQSAYEKPLLHTWSLAVEAQFYIIFGLTILSLKGRRHLFLPLLGIAAVASLFVGIALAPLSPKTGFFMMPTRFWQLALGIFAYVIAARMREQRGPVVAALAMLCVASCIASGLLFDAFGPFPSLQSYVACGSAAVALILFDKHRGHGISLLMAPLRYIGRISYGLYLWHWPPIVFFILALDRAPNLLERGVLIGGAVCAAIASYHLVEQPILSRRVLPATGGVGKLVVTCSAITFAVSTLLLSTGGAVYRYPKELQNFFTATRNTGTMRCPKLFRIINPKAEICLRTHAKGSNGVLVLGDSHADVLDEMLSAIADQYNIPLYLNVRSCDLGLFNEHSFCSSQVLSDILTQAQTEGVTQVIAISRWPQERMTKEAFEAQVVLLLGYGINLTIMEAVPYGPFFDPIQRARAALADGTLRYDGYDKAIYLTDLEIQRDIFDDTVRRFGGRVSVLKPGDFLCPADVCLFHTNGKPNYMDSKHLNAVGRELLKPMFETFFSTLTDNNAPPSHR
tara:strand:- start:27469 stop:29370 length:1902 start_codon:yes stop_codon:yes gene_type:complete